MKQYELIAFDADHTLFDFDKAEEDALRRMLMELGGYLDKERLILYKKLNMELWRQFENKEIEQEAIKLERFDRFFKKLGFEADLQRASDSYLKYLSEGSHLLENAKEVVSGLFERFELALITNGLAQVQYPRYENSGLSSYFKAFIVSEEVGAAKPDPLIFERLKEKFPNVKKEKILMVGDSVSSDIKGGMNFGIDTCWYNPGNKTADSGIRPTYSIKDLRQLYDILGMVAK